ncbi:MAG: anaerobic ribonucleoside-triphosphate reductase activating protein [Porcipelethomonas sp.]
MNYAAIKKTDIANGPGVRVSLFVSGCTHHCKGCFNSETWDFNYGNAFDEKVCEEIINALSPVYIAGFSLLGGEPFEPENQKELATLLKKIKETFPSKSIWCYTGYIFENEILGKSRARCEYTDEMLKYIDILVDGRFVEEEKNLMLKFRGSENQRIIDVQASIKSGKTILSELYN